MAGELGAWVVSQEVEQRVQQSNMDGSNSRQGRNRSGTSRGLVALAALLMTAGAALGQAQAPTNEELLRDFIHFTRIDRTDVAQALGKELLTRGLKPADFVKMVEGTGELARFEETIGRAMRRSDLESVAGDLLKQFERGKLERARDPEEIKANIAALTGAVRGRLMAQERLRFAGEYAVPQLLTALLDDSNPTLSAAVQRLLIDMGRSSIVPLMTAVEQLDGAEAERVCDVLGLIPYRNSLPVLDQLRKNSGNERVKVAAQRAYDRLGGTPTSDTSYLFYQLADLYYQERSEVTAFPGEDFQLLWSYSPKIGLVLREIRSEVFHEAMAMRFAERSLGLASENPDALALWIGSNFRRETAQPKDYANPAYPADRRPAMYFAVASGAGVTQKVLERAIVDKDTPLARQALAAVERTSGAQTLIGLADKPGPLLDALNYPNRRVQYEAALAIAASQPTVMFSGAERVVPTLAGAVRDAGEAYALVVGRDIETYQTVRGQLEGQKFRVLPFAASTGAASGAVAEVPAVDVAVLLNLAAETVPAAIDAIRGDGRLAATPILVLGSGPEFSDLRRRYENDVTIAVRSLALNNEQLSATVSSLLRDASGGPITSAEASEYSGRALKALRDLAVSGNAVLSVKDAVLSLIETMGRTTTAAATRMEIAEILSRVGESRAQQTLVDAALGASGSDRTALLGKAAESAKRFGNLLEARQVDRVVELAGKGSGDEAVAAAALMGALNLPNTKVVPLILGGEGAARTTAAR
jgi:hypothetical protein